MFSDLHAAAELPHLPEKISGETVSIEHKIKRCSCLSLSSKEGVSSKFFYSVDSLPLMWFV